MTNTVLVETLLECSDLQLLYDSLPSGEEKTSAEEKITACKDILDYLRERYVAANRAWSAGAAARPGTAFHELAPPTPVPPTDAIDVPAIDVPAIDVLQTRAELAGMDDLSLLRYGMVLKYICAVEANLAEMSLEASTAKLREARKEWKRRFGKSVIAESI